MSNAYFARVQEQTPTRFWINNVTREEAALAIREGAVGCTQNPAYTWKMFCHPVEREHVDALLAPILAAEPDDNRALLALQCRLVEGIAEQFLPIYKATRGRFGYVSIQGDPFREDVESMVAYARENRRNLPNIMAKIPATPEGLEAIDILVREGVPINATEVMSVRQALDVCRVYAEASAGMERPPVIYYSHIAGIFDQYLKQYVERNGVEIGEDALYQAGVSVAQKCYQITKQRYPEVGFISGGARGLHHFTEMVGADCSVTINWAGTADRLLEQNPPVVQRFWRPTPHSVIDELCEKLPDFRKGYHCWDIAPEEYEEYGPVVLFRSSFEQAWAEARGAIAAARAAQ